MHTIRGQEVTIGSHIIVRFFDSDTLIYCSDAAAATAAGGSVTSHRKQTETNVHTTVYSLVTEANLIRF